MASGTMSVGTPQNANECMSFHDCIETANISA